MVVDANGLVRLPDLAKEAGLSTHKLHEAMSEGLLAPAGRKRHNTTAFSKEDALFIIAVAALAIVAGIAFMTALRLVKNSGATIDGDAIKIPVPART